MNVDERVFRLYLYLRNHTFNREIISETLNVTVRQLSRLINKWQDEGILEYKSGVGRGNASTIIFLVNVESEFINYLIQHIRSYDLTKLNEILNYPMNSGLKKSLQIVIDNALYEKKFDDQEAHIHVSHLYRLPNSLDPIEANDLSTMTILNNISNCLYQTVGSEIIDQLVFYDEWVDDKFIIHLRKDIYFSNGDLMQAVDVVNCLKRAYDKVENYESFKSTIKSIYAVGSFKVVIDMKRKNNMIKLFLSQILCTIYKIIDNKFIFTGAYQIESIAEDAITTSINPYYYNSPPAITKIIFISDLEKYQSALQEVAVSEKNSKDYHSFEFMLFNPKTHLSLEERSIINEVVQSIINDKSYRDIDVSALMGKKFRLLVIKSSRRHLYQLTEKLSSVFEGLELLEIDFEEYISKHLDTFNCDVVIMNERLPSARMFFNLNTNGKLKDWYSNFYKTKHLYYIYSDKPEEYWQYAEQAYYTVMKEQCFLIMLKRYKNKYMLPTSYENVVTNSFGLIYYEAIVIANEVK